MSVSFAVILLGYLCIAGEIYLVKGSCAFPCLMHNRSYETIQDPNGLQRVLSRSDPTKITFMHNGTPLDTSEKCILRSGPFFMTRQSIEANETHGQYRCSKLMLDDQNDGIITIYVTDPMVHEHHPHLCDICNVNIPMTPFVIKDVNVDCAVVEIPEMGCNTPLVCSVTDTTIQSQCSCAQETFDSGTCCQ